MRVLIDLVTKLKCGKVPTFTKKVHICVNNNVQTINQNYSNTLMFHADITILFTSLHVKSDHCSHFPGKQRLFVSDKAKLRTATLRDAV